MKHWNNATTGERWAFALSVIAYVGACIFAIGKIDGIVLIISSAIVLTAIAVVISALSNIKGFR